MTRDLAAQLFEFADDNLKIASVLRSENCHVQSIYQVGQSFEKIIKSYYILIKTNIEYANEQQLYPRVVAIGHEIEDATLNLLIEVSEIDKVRFTRKANSPLYAGHPQYIQKYDALVKAVEGYRLRLENLRNRNLDANFVNNVHHYDDFVKEKYNQFIQGVRLVKSNIRTGNMSEYNSNFNRFLDCLVNLYPCLYKMNETTRYPLKDFGYNNLHFLNRAAANNNLIMMASYLGKTYGWLLENRYLLGEDNATIS